MAYQGGQENDLHVILQRDGETLHKYIQRFRRVHHNIPDVHPAAVCIAFHMNVRNRRMRSEMNIVKVRTINELYALADKCARAEEGRRLPGEDVGAEVDFEDDDADDVSTPQKKSRKHKGKTVMAVESLGDANAAKNSKAEGPDKEVAGCADCREAAAGDKGGKTGGLYCKIHRTKGHDLQECRQLEQLSEKQKQEYEKRDKEKGQDGAGGSGKQNRGGRGGRCGKAKQPKEKAAQGQDDGDEDEDGSENEFQNAVEAICVDGGASLHFSHRQLKQWIREVNAAEPMMGAQKPLKWSHTPIVFDTEDHPDRTTAVGCLPLLVSPTIRNLKVTKMLVDSGAGLNFISPDVIKRLQIPDKDLEETVTFQGISPGRNKPKGQITLPVTFGSDLNYRTEKIVFDVVKMPLPYNGILGRPVLAKFMAASHFAYNVIKMPGPMGVLTIKSNQRDAIIYADKLCQEAVAAPAVKAPAPAGKAPGGGKKKKKSG